MVTPSPPTPEPVPTAPGVAHPSISDVRLRRTVQRMARLAGALLRTPLVRVYLCDGPRSALRCCSGVEWEVPSADRLAARVRRTGKTSALEGEEEWPAGLAVPLRAGSRVIGVLAALSPEARGWTGEERRWLEDVAMGAAAEIELRDAESERAEGMDEPAAAPPPGAPLPRRRRGRRHRARWPESSEGADPSVTARLRTYITGSIHRGQLRPGDRLPSIRTTASAFAVTPYSALQAYTVLEAEGLVERRERSGIYVGQLELRAGRALPETGAWLADVLTQACEHQLKVPSLPDLIRRWTTAAPVRCLCVESCADVRVSLCGELRQQFGVEATAVTLDELLRSWEAGGAGGAARLADVDLLVTTAYHAAEVRRMAVRLEMPLLIATVNPQTVDATEEWLRKQSLTVICADPLFGERVRALHGVEGVGRVRVVLADDDDAVDALDRSEPVLLTPAARERMRRADFRLIAPLSPAFSLDFARKVSEVLVRLHIEAERA